MGSVLAVGTAGFAIAVLAMGLVLLAGRVRRRGRLQARFGPEYARTVLAHGSRLTAERDLAERVERRAAIDVRGLDEDERAQARRAWGAVQAGFVDDPRASLRSAEALLVRVMRERGYPAGDFTANVDLLAADVPDQVQHLRAAHEVSMAAEAGGVGTEDMRLALIGYRDVLGALVETSPPPPPGDPDDNYSVDVRRRVRIQPGHGGRPTGP